MAGVLRSERQGGIAVLTLNRPDALNALSRELFLTLRRALEEIEADREVAVTVLQAAQARAFSVGIDLKERQEMDEEEADAFRQQVVFPFYMELNERKKPLVAAVDGYCLGGGFELALAADAVIASEGAVFGLPEVRWGMIPAGGALQILTRLVGPLRAKEMAMTGRRVSSAEAERLGFVNRVVPSARLRAEAMATAEAIAGNVQTAVRGVKRCVDRLTDFRNGLAYDIEVSNACYAAPERKAAVMSFKDASARSPGDAKGGSQ